MVHSHSPRSRGLWRAVAVLATGLVLFLMIASVCPSLHERCCHHHDHGDAAGASCAVFAFSDGVTPMGTAPALPAPSAGSLSILPPSGASASKSADAWLNPPACGPPWAV